MKIICTENNCIHYIDGECILLRCCDIGDLSNENCVYFCKSIKNKP